MKKYRIELTDTTVELEHVEAEAWSISTIHNKTGSACRIGIDEDELVALFQLLKKSGIASLNINDIWKE